MTLDDNKRNNSNDDEYSNSTELLPNETQPNTTDTTSTAVITQQDEPEDNPAWTETDWERPLPKETAATVMMTPGKITNQYDDSDWRSPQLRNMFWLFSGLTEKKRVLQHLKILLLHLWMK